MQGGGPAADCSNLGSTPYHTAPHLPCPARLRYLQVLPLIALFMPLDAAASVMDGVLLGSQEAGWLGKTVRPSCGQLAHKAAGCIRARGSADLQWVQLG